VAVLELVTMWPFPAARVTEAACGAGAVVVAEMNLGQVVREVERVVRDRPVTGCHRWDGEPLTPADILDAIGRAGGEGR
jgi:2-oxoglutarate ferredoxin oxidoreductase subunit alpha